MPSRLAHATRKTGTTHTPRHTDTQSQTQSYSNDITIRAQSQRGLHKHSVPTMVPTGNRGKPKRKYGRPPSPRTGRPYTAVRLRLRFPGRCISRVSSIAIASRPSDRSRRLYESTSRPRARHCSYIYRRLTPPSSLATFCRLCGVRGHGASVTPSPQPHRCASPRAAHATAGAAQVQVQPLSTLNTLSFAPVLPSPHHTAYIDTDGYIISKEEELQFASVRRERWRTSIH
jgi:hypothetical protein